MNRAVIFAGGEIKNYNIISNYINENDYIICADSGYIHAKKLNIRVNLLVGDFDSLNIDYKADEIIRLEINKDDTDTYSAVKHAIKRGYKDFLLFGMLGGRTDHSLANISILSFLKNHDCSGIIINENEEITFVLNETVKIKKTDCEHFSLIAVSGTVRGVTIKGAEFCLDNADIEYPYQYATSNKVIDEYAIVRILEGKVLLIKNFC